MSRNQNSHFSMNPRANIRRSTFDISSNRKYTMNAGKLVPFYWRSILPGDSFDVSTSILARMQTLTVPLMDDLYMDTYYFFVPLRQLWAHWQAFCGESEQPWYDDTEYSVPTISFYNYPYEVSNMKQYVEKGSVADYLGLPLPNFSTGTGHDAPIEVSHLPFRAYVKIWNDWFRNENLQGMAAFNDEDASVTMGVDSDAWYGKDLLPVNKFKDYFTSALPTAQKLANPVTIGLGNTAPVFASSTDHIGEDMSALHWTKTDGSVIGSSNNQNYALFAHQNAAASTNMKTIANGTSASVSTQVDLTPVNLWADISEATGITINELRIAFATQKFYEAAARGGTRYIEILDTMFGVNNGDLRLQRAEYLGGQRLGININQAIQNSETATTPLGNIGAYSLTTDSQKSFVKSFTEHGILMGVCCIRYDHSYSQGIAREWTKLDKFDFYWPMFNGVGEMPIKNREIFFNGNSTDDEVFGYQEAYSDYKYGDSLVMAEMRPNYAQSLDFWHLGDDYESLPTLHSDWIVENGKTIDRTLAVSSNVSDQFLVDMYINIKATRPMPLFNVPGMDIL